MQAAGQIALPRLEQLLKEFRSLGYSGGAVDLSLHCASVWDTEGKGLAWWNEGCPSSDLREANFSRRQDCYKAITALLEATETEIEQASQAQNQSASEWSNLNG